MFVVKPNPESLGERGLPFVREEKMSARRHLRFFPSKKGSSKTLSVAIMGNWFGIKIVIGAAVAIEDLPAIRASY